MIYTLLAGVALGSSLGGDSALQPPRGWNSYDSYTWKVSEEEVSRGAWLCYPSDHRLFFPFFSRNAQLLYGFNVNPNLL